MSTEIRGERPAEASKSSCMGNPLYGWLNAPVWQSFSPTSFFNGRATLILKRLDILTYILDIVKLWNFNAGAHAKRPLLIKGDTFPWESPFLKQITDMSYRGGIGYIPAGVPISPQIFPLDLDPDKRAECEIMFRWCIVNSEIPPWTPGNTQNSQLEDVLDYFNLGAKLIILDGFLWNGRMSDLRKMLTRLKQREISIIVVASKMPPENFSSRSIWDNVLSISPWRNWRCSPNNIVVDFQRKMGIKVKMRRYLCFSKERGWQEISGSYDFLRPIVTAYVRNNLTAREIVAEINGMYGFAKWLKRPMTLANLARLKREWGIRSYKPEKKPRKKKQSKVHIEESSPTEMKS